MECERFKKLLKSWYIQVQNELLAPARMVDFMENHVVDCPICLMDPEAKKDIAKIIALILPQDKLRQTVRGAQSAAQDELADDIDDSGDAVDGDTYEEEESEEEESSDDSDGDDEDDEFDDDAKLDEADDED